MRFVTLLLAALLLFPATAAAADISIGLGSGPGVHYGESHEIRGRLAEGSTPLAGQAVELRGREYPYRGDFETVATAVTDAAGGYAFAREFDRNMRLRVVAPLQRASSRVVHAYVYPRPRSTFRALKDDRLRITQILRTPANVKLTARTDFYLGPEKAKTAPRVATAKPRKVGKGKFRARATVELPRRWNGAFRYASCFRYSGGSGLGDPGARCPKRYRFG